MLVSEFMTRNVISLSQDRTVEEAAKLMLDHNFGGLPIVDSSLNLVGIITESDFFGKDKELPNAAASLKRVFGKIYYSGSGDIEPIYQHAKSKLLKDVMTGTLATLNPDDTLSDAVNLMIQKDHKRIPVTENGKLVGIVTRHDIVKAFTLLKEDRPHA